jgi:hypothetical protein
MKAIWIPHSIIPEWQRGSADGEPDATVTRLSELVGIIDSWQ